MLKLITTLEIIDFLDTNDNCIGIKGNDKRQSRFYFQNKLIRFDEGNKTLSKGEILEGSEKTFRSIKEFLYKWNNGLVRKKQEEEEYLNSLSNDIIKDLEELVEKEEENRDLGLFTLVFFKTTLNEVVFGYCWDGEYYSHLQFGLTAINKFSELINSKQETKQKAVIELILEKEQLEKRIIEVEKWKKSYEKEIIELPQAQKEIYREMGIEINKE